LSTITAICGSGMASAQTYTINFKPKPGTVRYQMHMHTNTAGGKMQAGGKDQQIPAMNMVMSGVVSMTSSDLPNGQHKLMIKYNDVHMTMNGKSMDSQFAQSMKDISTTTILDKNGKPIKSEGTGAAAGMGAMMNGFSNFGFYGKPIKVGSLTSMKGTAMGMGISSTYKLLSVKKVGRRRLATFSVETMKNSAMPMSFIGKPITVVDVDTGMLVSTAFKMSMTMGTMGSSSTEMSITELH
jgi:hypothetical protein